MIKPPRMLIHLFLQQRAITEIITGRAMRHTIITITPTVIATALPTSLEHIEAPDKPNIRHLPTKSYICTDIILIP